MDSENSTDCDYEPTGTKNQRKITRARHECLACGKNISDRRNLIRHLRKIHCIEPVVRKPQLKCSFNEDCTFLCATSETLREHLEKAHDFQIEKKVFNFKSRADFERWKQDEEASTNARYVSYTGSKRRGMRKIYYLRCHRSGAIRCESSNSQRKRSKPAKGYTQCGATCPSSIRVAETPSGNIQVMYYPVHLGHSLDEESIRYMKLSSKEKEEIVGKLAQGEPVGKIVSDARKTKGTKLSRINLLQRRDVYNIKKKVNYLEKESDHDGKAIDSWVRSLNAGDSPDNPVVLYSPVDETKDYTLVLIHQIQKIIYSVAFDGSIVYVKTKKGKLNVDFNLTTVSVVCENGDGYPIAFCVSHKTEYITLYTFFKMIHQHFGVVKPQIFVSDNVSQYYLAWKNVMGECDNKLICTFDVESYWEQKLTALRCPVNKQKTASGELTALLHQSDKDVFESELSRILKAWEEDEDMKLFTNFFQKFYVKKRFEWATCYRIHSTRKETINKYLEPINAILDSIYVESYSRLETSLNLLFSFVRDVCLLKLLKWDEHVVLEKERETERKHEEGRRVGVARGEGSEWVVKDDDSDYVVRKIDSECDKKCGVFCQACDICTHDYSCVCSDYVTGFNVCRHLHAVGIAGVETNAMNPKEFVAVALKRSAIWKPDLEFVSEMEAPGGILSMAACDHILFTVSNDDTIQSWDLGAMKNVGKISTNLCQPQKLFVDQTTKVLWAGDSQGNVAKFEGGEETGKFELVEEIWDLMVTSNPCLVYTARDRDVVVAEYVGCNGRPRVMVKSTLEGRSPFCLAGNNFCFLNREGRKINVHENNVGAKFPKIKEIAASDLIINALASAGGDVVYSGGYDSTVKKWDLNSSACLGSLNLGCCVNAFACRSENEVYVARSDGFVTKIGG